MNADLAARAINTPRVTTHSGHTSAPVTKDSLVMAICVQVRVLYVFIEILRE